MSHPYKDKPEYCFWRESVARPDPDAVDPVVRTKFKIGKKDKIVTAGSCFAQHIARHLAASGFNYHVTEQVHPMVLLSARKYNYGLFSARYGNIYTSRQLLQLLYRAYGLLTPLDDMWGAPSGRVVDPFRPRIEPKGYSSQEEFRRDRQQHFAAVRRAVEEADVFIFTLGLTECWYDGRDGTVYPICPGTAAGVFDPHIHKFRNFGAPEVIGDLREAIAFMRERNPGIRFILTVSPVPLVATAEDRSVITSTVYSKAVLRVAAEIVSTEDPGVAYFPSYEVITNPASRGRYYADDLRTITEPGVSHVMRLFMQHYAADAKNDAGVIAGGAGRADGIDDQTNHAREMEALGAAMCDEEVLARAAT